MRSEFLLDAAFKPMARFLLLYSTTDGQTLKICRHLQQALENGGDTVDLVDIETAAEPDLTAYDKLVIGASIRYGRHSDRVLDFIGKHQKTLELKPSAFFSVNLVARKPGKDEPPGNPYVRKFFKRIAWRPRLSAVFAGRLDYPRYSAVDRTVIRLIMWMTGGPTDPNTVKEYTDWNRVAAFARQLARL